MRVLVQRVTRSEVRVSGSSLGSTSRGLVLFVGVTHDDTETDADLISRKIVNLRIFDDEDGNMNKSALNLTSEDAAEVSFLVISQFTLYANCRKGRRPSFVEAAPSDQAETMVEKFSERIRQQGIPVEHGEFGADMQVELVNDGPVTIWLDSRDLSRSRGVSAQSDPGRMEE